MYTARAPQTTQSAQAVDEKVEETQPTQTVGAPPTDSPWVNLKHRLANGLSNDEVREVRMTEAAGVLRENALALQFHTVLLEALLTGISLAMAQSWAMTILACVEAWLDATSTPLQNFISSLLITASAIAFAVVAAFALAAPRTVIYKCARVIRRGAKGMRGRVRRLRPLTANTTDTTTEDTADAQRMHTPVPGAQRDDLRT